MWYFACMVPHFPVENLNFHETRHGVSTRRDVVFPRDVGFTRDMTRISTRHGISTRRGISSKTGCGTYKQTSRENPQVLMVTQVVVQSSTLYNASIRTRDKDISLWPTTGSIIAARNLFSKNGRYI